MTYKKSGNEIVIMKDVGVDFSSRLGFFKNIRQTALDKITLNIFKGETLGIIGRNGCGKSTLLKILCGIYKPNRGVIIRNSNKISLQTLNAGFDRHLSGRDNALVSAMLQGMSKQTAIASLENIKAFSELGDAFEEPVKTYSSGMLARLGFSTAALIDVDVLLIDESLGVGDSGFRLKAENFLIDRINSEQTVVFVSHSAGQIKRLCQRVIWLEKGQIVAEGDAESIVDKYENSVSEVDKKARL